MSQPVSNSPGYPVQPRVLKAIADASARTGVDFDYMYSQARLESNLDPTAKAKTSSASGLFQFTRQTWLATVHEHGDKHGLGWAKDAIQKNSKGHHYVSDPVTRQQILALRYQPEAASAMAAEFAGDNHDHLKTALGRTPDEVDLYLAHFLGAGGASRFLKAHDANPDQSGAALFGKAAAANRPVFYTRSGNARSLAEIRAFFQAKMDADNANMPGVHRTARSSLAHHNPAAAKMPFGADAPDETITPALEMMSFRPMPKKLSLEFAQDTYARLAAMNGNSR